MNLYLHKMRYGVYDNSCNGPSIWQPEYPCVNGYVRHTLVYGLLPLRTCIHFTCWYRLTSSDHAWLDGITKSDIPLIIIQVNVAFAMVVACRQWICSNVDTSPQNTMLCLRTYYSNIFNIPWYSFSFTSLSWEIS